MERMTQNYQLRRQHRHLLLNGEMGIEDKINNISAGERTRSDRSSRQAR